MIKVHYMKQSIGIDRRVSICFGTKTPTKDEFDKHYACVKRFDTVVSDLNPEVYFENIFMLMQAENWSPNGEARDLIRSLGLSHTLMLVGDIIEVVETNSFYITRPMGFEKITF